MIRIAIADDHALVRQGLRRILEAERDLIVVGEAHNGSDVVRLVRKTRPDVLILDIGLPGKGGLEILRELRRQDLHTQTQILILTMHNEPHYALRSLRTGARGFLYKGADSDELLRAVRAVAQGQTYLPSEVERAFAERYICPDREDPTAALTPREFQVLCLIARGLTNREIARELGIQVRTVDSHRRRVLRKLKLRNNADLTRFAIRQGLVDV